MKTAFAIALTALGVAQLIAGPERGAALRAPAPRLPAISRPRVEPKIASEPRVEPASQPKLAAPPRDRESEAASAPRLPVSPPAERTLAEPTRPTEERPEIADHRREGTQQQQEETMQQRLSFAQARERMPREQHDRAWWDQRYKNIVRAGTGYYFLDAGYWYPAFGYDPEVDTYAYDGPIYANADLTPDAEISTVQTTLQADGYYNGSITGVLDPTTLQAIAEFQTANGLLVTGAIDQPTLEVLGLS